MMISIYLSVDLACDKNGCMNISSRPLLQNSRRYGYFDTNHTRLFRNYSYEHCVCYSRIEKENSHGMHQHTPR
jgi:hypothetical protein